MLRQRRAREMAARPGGGTKSFPIAAGHKRGADDSGAMVVVKRPAGVLSTVDQKRQALMAVKEKPDRFSQLMAPTMKLEGHRGEIYTMKFAPNGVYLATAGFDKEVYVWEVYGDCPHVMTLKGHKNAVQELHWSTDSDTIFTASADKTVMVWDTQTGNRIKKVVGHESFVNSVCPARRGPPVFVTGSDDGTTRLWDLRACRRPQAVFKQKYQVTAVCLSDGADQIFAGSLDNTVRCWDIRSAGGVEDGPPEPVYTMQGHTDTVTSLSLSPDGASLLSNSMDNTARIWNVRPFVAGGQRQSMLMRGHQHGFEKLLLKSSWSPDGTLVGVGSSDCMVCVFDASTGSIKYRLPGHSGSVNEVGFHPREPILGSCSSDKTVYLGEVDLQWDSSGAGLGGLAGEKIN